MKAQDPDIYTEATGSPDTLANLGPLRPLAGTWEGMRSQDEHPVATGSEDDVFLERYVLEPIDRQTNGPQLFYGLRYHTHITKLHEVETFHDQVGYWLWEPTAKTVTHTIAIPRGQVVLASGPAEPDSRDFELTASLGSQIYGILSNPFLDREFRTTSFRIRVLINDDGSWSYQEERSPAAPSPFVIPTTTRCAGSRAPRLIHWRQRPIRETIPRRRFLISAFVPGSALRCRA